MGQAKVAGQNMRETAYMVQEKPTMASDPVFQYMSAEQLKKTIMQTRKKMESAAKELDFMEAARLRDELFGLQKLLDEQKNTH